MGPRIVTSNYRMTIRGRVPGSVLEPYRDEFEITHTDTMTILDGPIIDVSHLNGVLAHLMGAGLELLEMTSSAAGGEASAETPDAETTAHLS